METETEIVRDVGNDGNYEIVVTEKRSHWLAFKVYHVLAVSGLVKWDGCSDITIDDEPLHFCGRDAAQEFAALLSAIYDLAAELIPSYEGG